MKQTLAYIFFILLTAKAQAIDTRKFPPPDSPLSRHSSFKIPSCQRYSSREIEKIKTEAEFCPQCEPDKLREALKPIPKIGRRSVQDKFLKELKPRVLSKLQESQKQIAKVVSCINSATRTEECTEILKALQTQAENLLPKVRHHMALMTLPQHPDPLDYSNMQTKYKIETSIRHPALQKKPPALNAKEIAGAVKEHDEFTDKAEQMWFRSQGDDKCVKQEVGGRFTFATSGCAFNGKRQLNGYIRTQRYRLTQVNRAEYEKIMKQVPHLMILQSVDGTESGFTDDLKNAYQTMGKYFEKQISRLQSGDVDDLKKMVFFRTEVEELVKQAGADQRNFCDVAETIRSEIETDELIEDLAIAAVGIAGTAVCAWSAGVGCAVTVAIGTQAVFIERTERYYQQAKEQFLAGLIPLEEFERRASDRQFAYLTAPLTLYGTGIASSLVSKHATRTALMARADLAKSGKLAETWLEGLDAASRGKLQKALQENPALRQQYEALQAKIHDVSIAKSGKIPDELQDDLMKSINQVMALSDQATQPNLRVVTEAIERVSKSKPGSEEFQAALRDIETLNAAFKAINQQEAASMADKVRLWLQKAKDRQGVDQQSIEVARQCLLGAH